MVISESPPGKIICSEARKLSAPQQPISLNGRVLARAPFDWDLS